MASPNSRPIRPGAGVMTQTRSPRKTASAIEWVTMKTVVSTSCQISMISRCISMRVGSSRAENGSSMRMILGLSTRVRAMATRCCWPPESWCGYLPSWPPSPTFPSHSRRELALADAERPSSPG